MLNKQFFTLLSASIFCLYILYTLYPTKTSNKLVYESRRGNTHYYANAKFLPQVFKKKGAFVTILCDTNMIEPTLVSTYTLHASLAKNPASQYDTVLLIPPNIQLTDTQLQPFKKLHTIIVKTTNSSNIDFVNDSCTTLSLIQLWNLLDYQKIIYYTPDILFDKNVDQLFNFPTGSSIKQDASDASLIILEPNSSIFEFLSRKASITEQLEYNKRIPLHLVKNYIHILGGPIKPWNFHYYHDSDWKKNHDPLLFYKWRRYSNKVRNLWNQPTTWKNSPRQQAVCDAYIDSTSEMPRFPIQDQFSVLISTYNPDRIDYLSLMIRHLLESSQVHTVYVTWHNPHLKVPPALYEKIKKEDYSRVRILTQTFDSLNNRFNPIKSLKTEAVYIIDDDIYIDIDDLEFTFKIWRNRKDSVVGHFPRLHTYDTQTHEATYNLIGKAPYSIILTKSMFIRSEYLFSYTCLLDPQLHEYVDEGLNCEDIGFMMMATGFTGAASTFVRTREPLQDFGLTKGISINNAHMPARSQCVSDFITRFWFEKDPLVLSFDTINRFAKQIVLASDWETLRETITG